MNTQKLRSQVEKLSEISGTGTSFVSLYTPSDGNIQEQYQKIQNEIVEAENIQSKQNRNTVQSSLKRISNVLQKYKEVPENGLVIFSGTTKENDYLYEFSNLPKELQEKRYVCGSEFFVDPLRALVGSEKTIGLVVIERGQSVIGTWDGRSLREIDAVGTFVRSKHKMGGQSQSRFENVIENQAESHLKRTGKRLKDLFGHNSPRDIDALLVAGEQITVKKFLNENYLPSQLQDVLVDQIFNIDNSRGNSLEQLLDLAETQLEELFDNEGRELVNQFENGLVDDDTHVTYGIENVQKATEYGAVETLLVSENMELPSELETRIEETGGEIKYISTGYESGERFDKTFKIGALLRFPIQ